MAKQKKYEFTGEHKYLSRFVKLQRIRALIDIPEHNVKAGDVGGWIQKVRNLPHKNNSWVADDAIVYGDSVIENDSLVNKNAMVSGRSIVKGKSLITGRAVLEHSVVVEDSTVGTDVVVSGVVDIMSCKIGGNSKLKGNLTISDSYVVLKNGLIEGNVQIFNSSIKGTDYIIKDAVVIKDSIIGNDKHRNKSLTLYGHALISNATISSTRDISIGEEAQVLDNAKVSGHEITIKGMAVVRGYVRIGLNMLIDEMALVDGGDGKPKSHHSLFGRTLNGDAQVFYEKTS